MANVTCIGTGTVGSAWAVVFARAGHQVSLYDLDPAAVHGFALPRIRQMLEQIHDAGADAESIADIEARIRISVSLEEAVCKADYVQESVREDADLKRLLFSDMSRLAPPESLLMSSTSALPGSTFMSDIVNPVRALVAHPVNPPSLIPLVELCGTGSTGDEQLETARAFFLAAGMEPITVRREIDGFILNRLQYTLVAEALHLVGEGYCSAEDIDRVVTNGLALRWASIGPFMTAHLNASGGYGGFVEQLGAMMKRMGKNARTDYDWGPELTEEITSWLTSIQPLNTIPLAQNWRDQRILATRSMQTRDTRPAGEGRQD
ncbi:3-hydroxyacyl-CoA dehydrogenase NAD-binding domain-containing protein [Hoeflea sp. CAU 1731]